METAIEPDNTTAGRVLTVRQREFLDELIERSGLINRWIMRMYLDIYVMGLDRWDAHISRIKGRRWLASRITYWPLRVIERACAVWIGGSLTSAEQATFGRIARISDYKLSRYNSAIFGSITGFTFFTSGEAALWLSTLGSPLDVTMSLTSLLLYSWGIASVAVDIWRFIDSFARRRSHMPIGMFPLIINSTTLFKRLYERATATEPYPSPAPAVSPVTPSENPPAGR